MHRCLNSPKYLVISKCAALLHFGQSGTSTRAVVITHQIRVAENSNTRKTVLLVLELYTGLKGDCAIPRERAFDLTVGELRGTEVRTITDWPAWTAAHLDSRMLCTR